MIPMADLYAQYQEIKEDIDGVILNVIKKSAFIRGEYVDKFESDFAKLSQRNYCVSCANGTDSLYLSMLALGVKEGDEVIVPSHSWISTSETVSQAGAKVIFCDTDVNTFTLEPSLIEEKISNRTVGIIPVHLYGQPADMDQIMAIARKYNLWVIEDCAQAHLAKYKGQLVGTFGNIASYSFYPGKNLGAMGDAGAIVTNDYSLAHKVSLFARHGGSKKNEHLIEGCNSRMDGIQAGILSVKLPHLKKWTAKRQAIANLYNKYLDGGLDLTVPKIATGREHVWHLYVIKHHDRDKLSKFLFDSGVQTAINYPNILPLLPAYSYLGHRPDEFPNSFINQARILSLPMYPELSEPDVRYIAEKVNEFRRS